MPRPFRWTRRRWYAAKRLYRLMKRLQGTWDPDLPPAAVMYRETVGDMDQWWPRDPLLTPVRERLAIFKDPDGIPF